MNSPYSLFDLLDDSSADIVSTKTLHALKDFYFGYQRGLQEGGVEMSDGEPPFSQFPSWLARRFGNSKLSLMRRWTRYDGGWWRIIEEQFGNGETGWAAFFSLLSYYRRQTKVVVCCSNQLDEVLESDSTPKRL